ncbi:hypothetical protein LGM63_30435 [Burkholderia cepacia]|uniref:hypothetical protein n=1 Tax=Burkholderia cepacia TaxID=292 RepID=UPI00158F2E2B|nr:hypothetical protein [Burkholderia cepacia]MCA7994975.1 hypothetical protein [Burkholderia cepacia]
MDRLTPNMNRTSPAPHLRSISMGLAVAYRTGLILRPHCVPAKTVRIPDAPLTAPVALTTASIRAVISGVNRAYARADEAAQATFFDVARAVKAVAFHGRHGLARAPACQRARDGVLAAVSRASGRR